jgi:hypothetical protein
MQNNSRLLTLVFGAALALAVVCLQVFQYQKAEITVSQSETEHPQKDEGLTVVTCSPGSTVVQHHVPVLHVIAEIFRDGREQNTGIVPSVCALGTLLENLFQVIISPNAP